MVSINNLLDTSIRIERALCDKEKVRQKGLPSKAPHIIEV
jgi:hypothetical protein